MTSSPAPAIPAAPRPSADPALQPSERPVAHGATVDEHGRGSVPPAPTTIDIFALTPPAAMGLLTGALEALVRANMEGRDVPTGRHLPREQSEAQKEPREGSRDQTGEPVEPVAEDGRREPPTAGISSSLPVRVRGVAREGPEETAQEHGHEVKADTEKMGAKTELRPPTPPDSPSSQHHADVPSTHKTPIGSPETHPADDQSPASNNNDRQTECSKPLPADEHALPAARPTPARPPDTAVHAGQRAALARRFVSKAVPPIALHDYLTRLHTYCPSSVAVYLAAGAYVRQLATGNGPPPRTPRRLSPPISGASERRPPVDASRAAPNGAEPGDTPVFPDGPDTRIEAESSDDEENNFLLPVTPRVAHRLALAALRVAGKALEDRGHAHARVAKVGGVGTRELARLEVGLCFLVDFELMLDARALQAAAGWMRALGDG